MIRSYKTFKRKEDFSRQLWKGLPRHFRLPKKGKILAKSKGCLKFSFERLFDKKNTSVSSKFREVLFKIKKMIVSLRGQLVQPLIVIRAADLRA